MKVCRYLKKKFYNHNQNGLLRNEAGVGLIELLVSTLIIGGVVAAILVAYSSLPASSSQGNALVVLQQDASLAMENMTLSIRETVDTDLVVSASQVQTTGGTFYVSGGLLLKQISGVDSVILGDFTFEEYGMQVASVTFDDDSDDATPFNTVTITLVVNLTRDSLAGGTNVVDTLTFTSKAYPRNRTI